MHLEVVLNAIEFKHAITSLQRLLSGATCTTYVEWSGRRVVKISGYSGTASIDRIASIFLQGLLLVENDIDSMNVQERYRYLEVQEKIIDLYRKCNEKRSLLSGLLTWIYKYRAYENTPTPEEALLSDEATDILCSFPKERFTAIFGTKTPYNTSQTDGAERRLASTKDMRAAAIAERKSNTKVVSFADQGGTL